MDPQKISKIVNLIEIAENNLKTAQLLIKQLYTSSGSNFTGPQPESNYHQPSFQNHTPSISTPADPEANSLEVVEGSFDGESMIGDDGKMYAIPANYASKTKLVVGDRMKRILTDSYREVYKVIQKAPSKRAVGMFASDENGEYVVMVDSVPNPIRVLKASITFAIKQQNLKLGDTVAILIPANTPSTWGAFDSIVKHLNDPENYNTSLYSNDLSHEKSLRPRPSLEKLKEDNMTISAPEADEVPFAAGMPNPFDSLDEFRM